MFTDWSAHNIGVLRNLEMRYYCENKPDQDGFVVNAKGMNFIDKGLADFLDGKKGLLPDPAWSQLTDQNAGKFMTATIRDVDKRPYPGFVKAYYAKSLKKVVHFYNTSQKYPHCARGSPGEKKTCWPAPEVSQNLETKFVGNLGLTDQEENDVAAFMKTLTLH
jgi:cytochrome c peroxidase